MTVQEINSAIIHGSYSNVELNSIIDAVKFARKRLAEIQKISLFLGDQVQFRSSRTGQVYTGILRERKIKNAVVETPQGRFRVPFSMLSAA